MEQYDRVVQKIIEQVMVDKFRGAAFMSATAFFVSYDYPGSLVMATSAIIKAFLILHREHGYFPNNTLNYFMGLTIDILSDHYKEIENE